MTNEIKNDTNNNNTVEQNQDGSASLSAMASAAAEVQVEAASLSPESCPASNPEVQASSLPPRADDSPSGAPGPSDFSAPSEPLAPGTDDGSESPKTLKPSSDDTCDTPPEHGFRVAWPLPPPGQRNRNGKVAGLPPDVREWLNLQLQDEVPYAAILDELEDRGYGHITQQNITSWKTCGGYNQWLSGHLARQERRSELETVCSLIAQTRGRLDEAALFLISSQLLSVVGDFDLSTFKKHLAEDPQTYLRLIQTLTKLHKARQTSKKTTETNFVNKPSSGDGDLEILPDAERGITEETLKKITDAIRLF